MSNLEALLAWGKREGDRQRARAARQAEFEANAHEVTVDSGAEYIGGDCVRYSRQARPRWSSFEEAASTSSSCSVTVHVQEEVGHNNVRLLRESGALDELLRDRLGQRDVPEVS